jgi:hypothetical protein
MKTTREAASEPRVSFHRKRSVHLFDQGWEAGEVTFTVTIVGMACPSEQIWRRLYPEIQRCWSTAGLIGVEAPDHPNHRAVQRGPFGGDFPKEEQAELLKQMLSERGARPRRGSGELVRYWKQMHADLVAQGATRWKTWQSVRQCVVGWEEGR